MITSEQARAVMEHALGAADSLSTSSTMNVSADYNSFDLAPDAVLEVRAGAQPNTLEISADGVWSSRRELFLGDGDVHRGREVWDVVLHVLLSPQTIPAEDSAMPQGRLVYVGAAGSAGGVIWRIVRGQYPFSHTEPPRVLRCNDTAQAVLADYPHLLWWAQ